MTQGLQPVGLLLNPMDIRAALKMGIAQLRSANVPSYTLAAELLLMCALERDRTWLYTNPEARLDPAAAEKYSVLIQRRASGEPTQYITGQQEFWALEFEVTPDVLIPRPETEHVVEVALERLGPRGIKIHLRTGTPSAPLRIADVGTGSGCLAIALAREVPQAEIFATDISAPALAVAARNAARHDVADRIHFEQADLLENHVRESRVTNHEVHLFDLIVSNPPYVAHNEAEQLPREIRDQEPDVALFPGPTGVEMYSRLIEQAGSLLRKGGILVLELGYDSRDHVRSILAAQPGWTNVSLTNDLAGIPRVISAERS
jgi:release factor glutamine methyltransferase